MKLGKDCRIGYTTGACAAAAAQAATAYLSSGKLPKTVTLGLPSGDSASFNISDGLLGSEQAACAVVKDAGGDRDITAGIKIWAEVRYADHGIIIKGGNGVGMVTEPGLAVAVGEPAINPVPRKMIINSVGRELARSGRSMGAIVTISAESGDIISRKTFNPKMGIIGGISILGTRGIVRPMSDDGWKQSLLPQIDQALAAGFNRLVLTFGNLGEKSAVAHGFSERQVVQMSNFVDFMLRGCLERKVKEVLLFGHLGKMIKVAGGSFNTHSRVTPQRLELLERIAIADDIPGEIVAELKNAKSGEAAIIILSRHKRESILNRVADMVEEQANKFLGNRLPVAAAITNLRGEIVGYGQGAKSILNRIGARERW